MREDEIISHLIPHVKSILKCILRTGNVNPKENRGKEEKTSNDSLTRTQERTIKGEYVTSNGI